MRISAGSRLGPYEILSPLGAGGMGEVYKARDTRLERSVAIKVLPQRLSSSAEVRQRFEREARTISQLSHPHICALYDVGRENDVEYLVMELLEGETLSERLARGALSLEQTLRYGIEMADALEKAHRQAIVHRDLKPGNVMLTKSGVKLLDFGLAKVFEPAAPKKESLTSLPTKQALTQEGTILGTFQYMAPEQLEGREADGRTDIFAFGCVLYEMATGKKAFSGASQASLISSIMSSDPPSISSIQPMSPVALDRVVKTCLAKDPEERWQSAADLGRELKWITEGSTAPPTTSAARSESRQRLFLWAALLVAIGALALAVLRRRPSIPPRTIRFTIPLPEGSLFGSYMEAGTVAVSPDGRRLAFTAVRPGGRGVLWVRDLETLVPRLVPGTEGAALPFWSPDSRFVGFFADGMLKRVGVSGGPPQTVCDSPYAYGGSWNSEGVILFAPDSNRPLMRVAAAGGAPVPETTRASGEIGHYWPSFLPDGRHYLLLVETERVPSTEIQVGELGKKERKEVMVADSAALYASPGYFLFVREGVLTAQRFDATSLQLQGEAMPIAEHVGRTGGAGPTRYGPFSASTNGVLAYGVTATVSSQLAWFDRHGQFLGAVGPPGDYADPELSMDGKRAAVCRDDPKTGTPDLWIVETSRGTLSRLTFHPRSEVYPVWSPDGSRLAFSWDKDGHNDVYLKPVGGGAEKLLLKEQRPTYPLDWSADGRFLLIGVLDPKTHADLWMLPLDGSGAKPLLQTPFNEAEARISPDGRFLAYTSDESGRPEVYVRPLPSLDEKWQVSPQGGSKAEWRRDGKELFYLAADGKLMSLELKGGGGFEGSTPRPIFQTRTPRVDFPSFHSLYAVTPDGQRFLVVTEPEGRASSPITVVLDWDAGLKG